MKRGQRAPWKVRYSWADGPSGTIACVDKWTAEHRQGEIERAAEYADRLVEVTVTHEPSA